MIIKTVFTKCLKIWEKVYNMLSKKKNYISSAEIYIVEKLNRNVKFNSNFSMDCDNRKFFFIPINISVFS